MVWILFYTLFGAELGLNADFGIQQHILITNGSTMRSSFALQWLSLFLQSVGKLLICEYVLICTNGLIDCYTDCKF